MKFHKTSFCIALLSAVLPLACGGGGGSSGGGFSALSINVGSGMSVGINQPIYITFNQPVDINTVSLSSTISITGLSNSAAIPFVPPVTGTFYIKPDSEGKVLVFQPNCPNDATNSNGGFIPSDSLGTVVYTIAILDSNQTHGSVIRSTSGASIGIGTTFTLTTFPSTSPFADPVPGPPSVTNLSSVPSAVGLNELSNPIDPIELNIDQPLNASKLDDSWFFLRFENPSSPGTFIPIPSILTIAENCNASGGAKVVLTPRGVLPSDTILQLIQGPAQGLGLNDQLFELKLLKTIHVSAAASGHADALIESFDDSSDMDTTVNLGVPFAEWGSGVLKAAAPFPGQAVTSDIEIGIGTANGFDVSLDTTFSTLLDTNGQAVNMVNGVIYCRNFTLKEDTSGANPALHGRITGFGPNPIRIVATGTVKFEKNTRVFVDGGDSPGVVTTQTGNYPEPGALGRCSGGDGGTGSPVAIGVSIKGGDGNGAFNIAGIGGRGGHAGYGDNFYLNGVPAPNCPEMAVRGGGGGGGSFAASEVDGPTDGPFCYGRLTGFFTAGCTSGNMPTGADDPPPCGLSSSKQTPCDGAQPSSNTAGENGTIGTTGIGTDNMVLAAEPQKTIFDAITGAPGAVGGTAGDAVFTNGSSSDNFYGTKINYNGTVNGTVVTGELATVQGGQGGGGGGDAIGSLTFPPPAAYNSVTDFKGAGAGGGAGAFWVQAIGRITVNGLISAKGGDGGAGEIIFCANPAAGGSGGGAGGMIILESLTGVTLGDSSSAVPQLRARGGNRGFGSSLKNVVNGLNEKCSVNLTCLVSFPAGIGWNTCCTTGNTNTAGVSGFMGISRRSFAKSLGGAGGAGLVLLGVPHNADGTLKTGALIAVKYNNTNTTTLSPVDLSAFACGDGTDCTASAGEASPCNDDCYSRTEGLFRFKNPITTTTYKNGPNINPNAHVIQPSFSTVSRALSNWQYIGAADQSTFSFNGTDVDGKINFGEQDLASSSSGVVIESETQATIANSTLYTAFFSNPKALIGAHFKPTSASTRFSIVNAEVDSSASNTIRIFTDPNDGSLTTTNTWKVIQRYYDLVAGTTPLTSLSEGYIKIFFQGADESFEGSGVVDPSVTTLPTSISISTLNNKRFARFLVTFSLLDDNGTPDSDILTMDRPAFEFLKLPFTFNN